jgi:hypothetical protein
MLRALACAIAALPALAHCAWSDKAGGASLTVTGNPVEMLAIARAMRDVPWLYPAVEIVHIIGFSILVGSAVMFDLRVLGFSRQVSVRALRPLPIRRRLGHQRERARRRPHQRRGLARALVLHHRLRPLARVPVRGGGWVNADGRR